MVNLIEIDVSGGIATVTLNDPNAAVNTVSTAWITEMTARINELKADDQVTGLIIASAKTGFMAGADLKFILDHATRLSPADAFAFSQSASHLFRSIETCGKPVVAALEGFALGGGYELALACTWRILADSSKATIGLPEVNVGLLPGAGGTQRLPRMIGVKAASEALLSGRTFLPAEALKLGMVDQVVPAGTVLNAARSWLGSRPTPTRPWDVKGFNLPESEGLLSHRNANFFSTASATLRAKYGDNYPAPIAILTCIFEGVQLPFDKSLRVESRHFARLLTHSVSRNIIRTMFVGKGLAEKGVRRPVGVPKALVSKLGVLGAGMMGNGIAYVAALAGIDVVLLDISREAAIRGKGYSEKLVAGDVAKGRLTPIQAEALLARISPTDDYAELAGTDLVIETVFEDRAIKGEVTGRAFGAIGNTTLFASNTSTLPISGLAEAFPRRADFIGMHFFSPVERMPLVELIMGTETGPEALARSLDFVAQIRKTPIVVNDSRGFYTSRVFLSFVHEGAELLRDGVAPALIENAARMSGMPVGPLAVSDEVTLDLPIKIERQARHEEADYDRPDSLDVLETMAETLHRSGRRSGGGYYDYPMTGKKRLWPGLTEHFPPSANQPAPDEVCRRLLYRQALETVRCLEEGVIAHAADADLGALLGWGFPIWTGGTLSLIETIGIGQFVKECDVLAERYGARFLPPPGLRAMAAFGRGFERG